MYCYNCGKQIADSVHFCRYCGAPQDVANDLLSSAPQPTPYTPPAPPPPQPAAYTPPPAPPQPTPQPQYQAPPQPQPQYQAPPQPPPAPEPQYQAPPQPQPVYAQAAPSQIMLASQACSYQVATESEFKKFQFGGMPEGTVEIYEDRLVFFQKNKMVKMAFGMIGSALSGRGKPDLTIAFDAVRRDTLENRKNVFRFHLTDGRIAYVQFNGLTGQSEARDAMRRFLKV